ncbi:MAG: family 31 glucosidase, partial [Treponema sp.]|nr:family 31 glucosidase [Clostridia bacterium]MCF0242870.1 family 31 glucosidase [Treponema sp.]
MFVQEENALILKKGNETVRIEPWGKDALRVRSTLEPHFTGNVWGLTEEVKPCKAKIKITREGAEITNGKMTARFNGNGVLSFWKGNTRILHEYFRAYDPNATKETCCTKIIAREWKGLRGGYDYKLTVRFEPNDGEKLYGMGQYQMPYLDVKGCQLELAQRNGQVSVPFAVSSLGYGFMWNNPG